jgi:hypothetical protein
VIEMTEDLINLRLSKKASEIADRIYESHFFDDRMSIAKFAMAYAIKNHFDEIDPIEIDINRDAAGLNYNVGSIDGDKFISKLIESLYPDIKTPYKITRALMIYGLEKLGELLDNGQLYPLSNVL